MSYQTQEIKIKGMSCSSCVNSVSTYLKDLNGVENVEVDLEKGVAKIKINVYKISKNEIIALLNQETPYEAS